jgi:hypothetical protein
MVDAPSADSAACSPPRMTGPQVRPFKFVHRRDPSLPLCTWRDPRPLPPTGSPAAAAVVAPCLPACVPAAPLQFQVLWTRQTLRRLFWFWQWQAFPPLLPPLVAAAAAAAACAPSHWRWQQQQQQPPRPPVRPRPQSLRLRRRGRRLHWTGKTGWGVRSSEEACLQKAPLNHVVQSDVLRNGVAKEAPAWGWGG